MGEPLPLTNRCNKCGQWFHNAHVCALSASPAAREGVQEDAKERWSYLLDESKAALLRDTIGKNEDDGEASPITLWSGDGHSGFGLYASMTDYPEEGSVQLVAATPPLPQAPVDETVERDALRELLDAHLAPMPPYIAGKVALDAWTNRMVAARKSAIQILSRQHDEGERT